MSFVDDPLTTVTQDNIDIALRIGPASSFERRSVDGGADRPVLAPTSSARSYHIIDAEVELTKNTEANFMEATIVGDDTDKRPSEGDPLNEYVDPEVVTLDVYNQLTEAERDSNNISRVFTGQVANAARMGDHSFKMTAFWPGHNIIKNKKVLLVPPPVLFAGLENVDYNPRRNKISTFAELTGNRITRGTPFEPVINMSTDGIVVGERPDGTEIRYGYDGEITLTTWKKEVNSVLETLARGSLSEWDVDRYGDFYFGAARPRAHKLRYITDTSAGKQSPPWRSVQVIGDGIVSQDGWNASAQINEEPEVVRGNLGGSGFDADLAEPTFVYRNMEIQTRDEAMHVLNKIREEIREQAGGGHVEVVGHPEVWPGDAIELPDARDQPLGLDRFLVKKVIHRLNSKNGFMTRIECGGVTNAADTVFVSDVDELKDSQEYDSDIGFDTPEFGEDAL